MASARSLPKSCRAPKPAETLRSVCVAVQLRLVGYSGLVALAVAQTARKLAAVTAPLLPTTVMPAASWAGVGVAVVPIEPSL